MFHAKQPAANSAVDTFVDDDLPTEKQNFIIGPKKCLSKKAKLARQETDCCGSQTQLKTNKDATTNKDRCSSSCCFACVSALVCKRCILILLAIIVSFTLIYALPILEMQPKTPLKLPKINFNFRDGPLMPLNSLSSHKIDKLFEGQLHAAESLAFDSSGNMFTVIEGGFVLYARLNSSSQVKKQLYDQSLFSSAADLQQQSSQKQPQLPVLVKIAELNRAAVSGSASSSTSPRRGQRGSDSYTSNSQRYECSADEQLYGPYPKLVAPSDEFRSSVRVSRCSKPLGVRLSDDESYLYVIDTLRGIYRVSLRVPERPNATLRLVTKLVDFKAPRAQMLPIYTQQDGLESQHTNNSNTQQQQRIYLNVTLMAVDDLTIDTSGGDQLDNKNAADDVIYMTCASQLWRAVSFLYDVLEGRPTGIVLRYDTGSNELSVLDPIKVAHVRTSTPMSGGGQDKNEDSTGGIGAPRLDENDLFDDRPLFFPNGIQLMDDKSALLIADTFNKRILKHYVRGARAGTTDHFAWTPMMPDNVRRSYDTSRESYWAVGCGESANSHDKWFDTLDVLMNWPTIRVLLAKTIYLFGVSFETVGSLTSSTTLTDFGYTIKTGESVTPQMCSQMIAVQYDARGEIVRSVHSAQMPRDLSYFSQVDELIVDGQRQLYIGSPRYSYIARVSLPD